MQIIIDFKGSSKDFYPSITLDEKDMGSNHLEPKIATLDLESTNSTQVSNKDILSAGIIKERLRNKTVETFVWKNRLYLKVGDFYGWLNVDNDFTNVVSSCYYENRKKANANVIQ